MAKIIKKAKKEEPEVQETQAEEYEENEETEIEQVEVVKVTRKELAALVREKVMAAGLAIPPKVAEAAVVGYEEAVIDVLKEGNQVTLPGFGTFQGYDRAATTCRNPQKPDETIEVPACRVPKFKPGKSFKDALKE